MVLTDAYGIPRVGVEVEGKFCRQLEGSIDDSRIRRKGVPSQADTHRSYNERIEIPSKPTERLQLTEMAMDRRINLASSIVMIGGGHELLHLKCK